MDLPNDPFMLLSVINTKLRDFYANFDMLCDDMDINRADLEKRLNDAGFTYDEGINKFI